MNRVKPYKGASALAKYLQKVHLGQWNWQLRWKPVCASTENSLSKWIEEKPFIEKHPRALFAGRQIFGKGQKGRSWESPFGGIWVSAAIPCKKKKLSPGLMSLSIALELTKVIERYGLQVNIKWPNDLLIGNKKLAGYLMRLIHRGENLRLVRIGLGLNILNKTPSEGISLMEAAPYLNCNFIKFQAEVLRSFEVAMQSSFDSGYLCNEVEKRLWSSEFFDPDTLEKWKIEGLGIDGTLKLKRGILKKKLFIYG